MNNIVLSFISIALINNSSLISSYGDRGFVVNRILLQDRDSVNVSTVKSISPQAIKDWETSDIDKNIVPSEKLELELYAYLFNDLLKRHNRDELDRQAGVKKQTCFLCIFKEGEIFDPPKDIFSMLGEYDINIYPYSHYEKIIKNKTDNKFASDIHGDNNKIVSVITIRIFGWINNSTAKIGISDINGPLCGNSSYAIYKFINGKWEICEKLVDWIH